MLATLLLAASIQAAESSNLLRSPSAHTPFAPAQPDQRRPITAGTVVLTEREHLRLLQAGRAGVLRLPSIEAHLGITDRVLEFQRFDPFATGARVWRASAQGVVQIEPRRRHYFIATSPYEGVGITLDPATGEVTGFAARGDTRVELLGFAEIGIEVTAVEDAPDAINECGTVLGDQPPDVIASLSAGGMTSRSEAPQGTALSFQAVIAIDTDTEWMAGKSNDTAVATTWITDLFLAMNVFYERDVETRLLLGDLILRVGSDPYSEPSNRPAQLNEFSEYWRVNMGAIDRDFAALLSGRSISAGSFSGIAWLDQYCQAGFFFGLGTVGSYSFNAIGSSRTAANTAAFVGHEIGHNLGSPHTHCYSPPVDHCYNAESGCYSGTPSCPAGGKGTIMSYCHFAPPAGANCGTNKQEFHPTVQALLEARLAANSPACIAPFTDPDPPQLLFKDSFETP
jgi:hypothetical protein